MDRYVYTVVWNDRCNPNEPCHVVKVFGSMKKAFAFLDASDLRHKMRVKTQLLQIGSVAQTVVAPAL